MITHSKNNRNRKQSDLITNKSNRYSNIAHNISWTLDKQKIICDDWETDISSKYNKKNLS